MAHSLTSFTVHWDTPLTVSNREPLPSTEQLPSTQLLLGLCPLVGKPGFQEFGEIAINLTIP